MVNLKASNAQSRRSPGDANRSDRHQVDESCEQSEWWVSARLDLVHEIQQDVGGQARRTAVDEVGKTIYDDSHEVRRCRREHTT
jgi:hypothetical protein